MQRCLQLAQLGLGNVAPNPMVGCVIVYDNKIIGEGYHQFYGGAHAEVNAINSVKDKSLLPFSTLYVNLEPCAHYGKTPPCADLIISHKIPMVVIGCVDVFNKVNGKGIKKLKAAGVKVIATILEEESLQLNKRFFTFHNYKRPYIILKWAQSSDGFIGSKNYKAIDETGRNVQMISNALSQKLVHKWRSEEQAILIGTNTAMLDNPKLNTREWIGKNPIRIVLDSNLRLPNRLNIFDKQIPTIIFTEHEKQSTENLQYIKINFNNSLNEMMNRLYEMQIQSVIVEGGSALINSLINQNQWDEARVFTSSIKLQEGVKTPMVMGDITDKVILENDTLLRVVNRHNF